MPEVVTDIIVTPATIWYAPYGETYPDSDVAYGAAWGGNWTKAGFTAAPVTLGYVFEEVEKMVEQSLARVGAVKSKEELTLVTQLAEATGLALKLAFGGGTITTVAAGASQHGEDQLDIGDDFALDEYTWGFEGYFYDSAGAEQPIRVFIHKGTASAGGEMEFGKASQTGIPLTIKAHADMTLAAGQRLFQVFRVTAEPTS